MMTTLACFFPALVLTIVFCWIFRDELSLLGALVFLAFAWWVIWLIFAPTPQWKLDSDAKQAAKEAAERQPRLIRTGPDGCKVYTFKEGGHWHYYTVCPRADTTTESSWTEKSGKTTVIKTETIETKGATP